MRSTFIPGPLSSIILETYCFTAKTTFMVANWQVNPTALPAPFSLAKLTPGLLAGSQRLPPRPALASGSPGSPYGAGSCSSAARGGRPSLPAEWKNPAETPQGSNARKWFSTHLQSEVVWGLDSEHGGPWVRGAPAAPESLSCWLGETVAARGVGELGMRLAWRREPECSRGHYVPLILSWVAREGLREESWRNASGRSERYLLSNGRGSSSPASSCH